MTPTVRVCEKCGWEYPMTYTASTCRFCKTRFKMNFCTICGDYEITMGNSLLCKTCRSQSCMLYTTKEMARNKSARSLARRVNKRDEARAEWLSLIEAEGTFEFLTEQQWLEACVHFKGCALCSSSSIDTRSFFVPYHMGGRYAAWNIIPLCESCTKRYRLTKDPFIGTLITTEIKDYLRGRFSSDKPGPT